LEQSQVAPPGFWNVCKLLKTPEYRLGVISLDPLRFQNLLQSKFNGTYAIQEYKKQYLKKAPFQLFVNSPLMASSQTKLEQNKHDDRRIVVSKLWLHQSPLKYVQSVTNYNLLALKLANNVKYALNT